MGAWQRAPAATNTYYFTYTNRAELLADGWSFLATVPGGGTRNTEITNATNGGLVSYDQTAHPGSLQIPCDLGDLYGSLNNTRNSLFRTVPTNWVSLRLQCSFAPTTNFQQLNFALYQDDDNYLEIGDLYNSNTGGNLISLFREINQFPLSLKVTPNTATNLFFRLDQDLSTGNVTAYSSADGNTWVASGTLSESFNNAQLCIWSGSSPVQWTNGLAVASVHRVDVITSDNYAPPPPVLVVQPQHLFFNAIAGQPCTNRQALHVVLSNNRNAPVNWNLSNSATWCSTSITNGVTAGTCDVSVNTAGLAPGIYQASLGLAATGATSAMANVTLIVNTNARVQASTWQEGHSGAMTVWVDDSFPTAFDDLSTNGLTGTYVMWHLGAPAFYASYYHAGMELGSHTVDHPCFVVNDATATYEISTNLASLLTTSPEPASQAVSFAWPCGATCTDEEALAANYFLVSRGYNFNQLEDPNPYDFMNLKSFNSHEHFPYPPADLKTNVDLAIAQGRWNNMVLHSTNNDNGSILYSLGKDIWFAPAGTVIKYILQRQRMVITNYSETPGGIEFSVYRLPFDPSPIRSFETAITPQDVLTLQVDVTTMPQVYGLTTNGSVCPYTTKIVNSRTLLLFDMLVTLSPQTVVLEVAPNTPPMLPTLPDVTVNELSQLVVTNTGSDTNSPPQALSYTLVNPPAGAQIDTNGIITWTPFEGQGPGTYTITTVVTDDGAPPLPATNSFNVTVNEVNLPPVLPNQPNRNLSGPSTLVVTNTAFDPDIPAEPLTYQLVSGPPNAVIDTNGVIIWTPTPSQIPSTNVFTTIVTDTNQYAVNAKQLSATNSFTVYDLLGPLLSPQTNQVINELTTLVVTNAAIEAGGGQVGTNSVNFTYTNRDALLADGWSFVATLPNGAPRNTENTNAALGPVVSYDQSAHPGVLRIPCGGGDLWSTLNDTTNSLFRSLPVYWVSVRLAMIFSPTANYQQAYLALYQNDDNYVEAGYEHGNTQQVLMVQEAGGAPNVINSAPVTTTNLLVRLDRNVTNGNVTAFYSLDVLNWTAIGTVTQVLNNSRLCIWTGGSMGPIANLDLQRLDVVVSNSVGPVLTYQLLNPPAGAGIDGNGIITWTPSEAQGPSTNVITTAVNDYGSPPLAATNSFTVVVNEVNLPPLLPEPGDLTILSGATLVVTNTASDPDIPVNTLTYQLSAAPPGASIDTNGLITWTPAANELPSTNVFRTVVTDYNPWAVNAQHLSTTNRFTVYVQSNEPPVFGGGSNYTINEGQTLVLSNYASAPGNNLCLALPLITNSFYFTYTNRTDLLADGWSFIEMSNGVPFNTEITDTNVGVISYAQTNGALGTVMRIPCDIGDLWGKPPTYLYDFTRNSIFRSVPSNWVSLRMLFSFAPTEDFQQAHIGYYVDVDNYVEAGFAHNVQINPGPGGKGVTLVFEENGLADHFTNAVPASVTNIVLRLDHDPNSGYFSVYYSLDTTNWTEIATIPPTYWLPGPALPAGARLGIWVGSNPQPFAQNPLYCDVSRVDVVLTNAVEQEHVSNQTLSYSLLNPPPGASINSNGVVTWTPLIPGTNLIATVVTDSGVPPLSATNDFTVVVNPPPAPFPIKGVSVANNLATVTWGAVSGQTYRLQFKNTLADANWTDVVPDITATGTSASQTNALSATGHRFFRVMFVP